jgi:hypothetical protein
MCCWSVLTLTLADDDGGARCVGGMLGGRETMVREDMLLAVCDSMWVEKMKDGMMT